MRVGGTFNITLGTPSPQAMPRVVFSGWATGRHSLKVGSELAMVTHTAHCLAVTLQCAPRPNNPWEGVLTTPGHREAAKPGSRGCLWLQGPEAQLGDGMAIRLGSSKRSSQIELPGPQALLKSHLRWP